MKSRAKRYSYARVASELSVSTGTLVNWNAELEAQIARARATELKALQEEVFLLKEGRIWLLGEQLKAIQAEIGSRDLSKVKVAGVVHHVPRTENLHDATEGRARVCHSDKDVIRPNRLGPRVDCQEEYGQE